MILSSRANDISVYEQNDVSNVIGRKGTMSYNIQEREWRQNASSVHIRGITQTIAIGVNQHLKNVIVREKPRYLNNPEYVLESGFLGEY
jgi:hypothetical protein